MAGMLGTEDVRGEKPRLWVQTDLWSKSHSLPFAASLHPTSDKWAGQHLSDALEIPQVPSIAQCLAHTQFSIK